MLHSKEATTAFHPFMRIYTGKRIAWASWLKGATKVVAVIHVKIGEVVAIQLERNTMHAKNVAINTKKYLHFTIIKGNRTKCTMDSSHLSKCPRGLGKLMATCNYGIVNLVIWNKVNSDVLGFLVRYDLL